MAKAVFLNGHLDNMEIIELEENQSKAISQISELLEAELASLRMLTFGYKYLVVWQNVRDERTSLELTASAGFSFPQFIRSRVVIYKFESEMVDFEEINTLVDVDMDELKEYFNMENAFWALREMYLTDPFSSFH